MPQQQLRPPRPDPPSPRSPPSPSISTTSTTPTSTLCMIIPRSPPHHTPVSSHPVRWPHFPTAPSTTSAESLFDDLSQWLAANSEDSAAVVRVGAVASGVGEVISRRGNTGGNVQAVYDHGTAKEQENLVDRSAARSVVPEGRLEAWTKARASLDGERELVLREKAKGTDEEEEGKRKETDKGKEEEDKPRWKVILEDALARTPAPQGDPRWKRNGLVLSASAAHGMRAQSSRSTSHRHEHLPALDGSVRQSALPAPLSIRKARLTGQRPPAPTKHTSRTTVQRLSNRDNTSPPSLIEIVEVTLVEAPIKPPPALRHKPGTSTLRFTDLYTTDTGANTAHTPTAKRFSARMQQLHALNARCEASSAATIRGWLVQHAPGMVDAYHEARSLHGDITTSATGTEPSAAADKATTRAGCRVQKLLRQNERARERCVQLLVQLVERFKERLGWWFDEAREELREGFGGDEWLDAYWEECVWLWVELLVALLSKEGEAVDKTCRELLDVSEKEILEKVQLERTMLVMD